MRLPFAIAGAALAGLGACTEIPRPAGPEIEIRVAPVDYPGINKVCYDLTVLNGAPTPGDSDTTNDPDVVWSESGLCSDDYGNLGGGDISYVGPCDADVDGHNYVELTLADVWVGATSPVVLKDQIDLPSGDPNYENPCPTGAPCVLDFECLENADVFVEFNLVIMRDANQGWFDIAVNFDDIFCSAKFDTCYPGEDPDDPTDDEPIRLLHDRGDERHHTAVLGFACTGGPLDEPGAANETQLYMNDIVITCPPVGMQAALLALNVTVKTFLDVDVVGTGGVIDTRLQEIVVKDDCLAGAGDDPTPCAGLSPSTTGSVDDQRYQLAQLSAALADDVAYFAAARERITTFANQGQQLWPWPLLRERVEVTRQLLAYFAYPEVATDVAGYQATLAQIVAMVSPIALSPSAGVGNIYTATSTPAIDTADSGNVWQYAVYTGQEQLDCGTGPVTFTSAGVAYPVYQLQALEFLLGGDATAGFHYYPLVNGVKGSEVSSPYPAAWGTVDAASGVPANWVRKIGPISCDKVYWDVAIGIEGLPAGCTLSTSATASAGILQHELVPDFFVPSMTPKGTTYPVFGFTDIPLTKAAANNGSDVVCGQYPLDDSGTFLKTGYTLVGVAADFQHEALQVPDGVLLAAEDPDRAPRLVVPTILPRADSSYPDRIGGSISGGHTFDGVDWKVYQVPDKLPSDPSALRWSYKCEPTTVGGSANSFDIYYLLVKKDGEAVTAGFQLCNGTTAALRERLGYGDTVYLLTVGSKDHGQPPMIPSYEMFSHCVNAGFDLDECYADWIGDLVHPGGYSGSWLYAP